MAKARKQSSKDLLNEINNIPREIKRILALKNLRVAKKRKKINDYIEGLVRQIGTRMRSKSPSDRYPPSSSGYGDWDYAYMETRRKELSAIKKLRSYRKLLGI